jgi:hypothetical protein
VIRTRLAAAIFVGCGLAGAAPATVALAAPAPFTQVTEASPGQRPASDERTPLTSDGIAVLGTFGGAGVIAAFGLFVATRPRGLD